MVRFLPSSADSNVCTKPLRADGRFRAAAIRPFATVLRHSLGSLSPSGMRQHRSLEQGQIPDVREVVTTRDEGATQTFAFALKGDYLESTAEIPEPHAFKAALKCGSQRHDFVFEETVLLLCMQLKEISLGVVLVLCFSIGLALTMVSAGVLAALSVEHVSRRWSGFSTLARRAPYLSGALIILVGLYTGAEGWRSLHRAAEHSAAITITSG